MPAAQPGDHLRAEARRLGDLVVGHPEHVDDVLPQLVSILTTTDDPQTTRAAVDALGAPWHPSATAALLEHVPLDHPDPDVRLALTRALPTGVDAPGDLRDRATSPLVRLTRDPDDRVRDWAAFGLGQLQAQSPAVRDALAALLDDPDRDTRCEALLALAAAGDQRTLPVLHRRLQDADDVTLLELQAASALGAPELHPPLARLAEDWAEDQDEHAELATTALARCAPDAPRTARGAELDVLEQVRRLLPRSTDVRLDGGYPRTVLTITTHPGDHFPDLDLPLWDDGQRPDAYPSDDVLNAVCGTLAHTGTTSST